MPVETRLSSGRFLLTEVEDLFRRAVCILTESLVFMVVLFVFVFLDVDCDIIVYAIRSQSGSLPPRGVR